ncbi:DoxX family protein [Chitiniphilus purpureus]|uniref:DoxX family protein n=1 Tax=Chitiniphilus purpureus TaxID=2981137 RepID=A0ABY6DQM7_9NEIS|nr:DoxX family protein [Chitiniphilus sp. CD1]UXY16677.1 DoxX family protein [Chitiniphilus sp. CD1]
MKKVGWLMTALFALFMVLGSAAPKLLGAPVAMESMTKIGWPAQHLMLIGVIEIVCTVLFIVPRTAPIGAILLTGLFGGALASHWRVDSPLFSHTLFGIYLGALMWLSLWLRARTIRKILPLMKSADQE